MEKTNSKFKKCAIVVAVLICAVMCLTALGGCTVNKTVVDADGITYNEKKGELYIGTMEGKSRIKVSYSTGCGRDWVVNLGKKFLFENPTEYYFVIDADSEVTDSLGNRLSAGVNLSDLYFVLNCSWQAWAAKGYIEPLNDVYAAKPDGEAGKTISEKMNGEYGDYGKHTVNGTENYYVMPWNQIITGFVYNETMFKKYNWQVPTTMEQMITLCDKILADTNSQVTPFVYPGAVGGYFTHVAMNWWLQSSGIEGLREFFNFENSDIFDPSTQPSKGKKEMLDAFNKLFGPAASKYSLSGSMSKKHIAAQTSFVNGQAAMIPNGDWMEVEMKDILDEAKIDIKMMNVPAIETAQKNEDGSVKNVNYGVSADVGLIPTKAGNVSGAKKFMQFINSEKSLNLYTQTTGRLRPLEYNVDSSKLTGFANSCIDIWKNSDSFFDNSKSSLYINGYLNKFNAGDPFINIVTGKTTPSAYCSAEYDYVLEGWDKWN